MQKLIDPRKMEWVHKPGLYLQNEEQIVIETEPYTDLFPHAGQGSAPLIVLPVPECFCFSVRIDQIFEAPFDESGLVLLKDRKPVVIAGLISRDSVIQHLRTAVYHDGGGDLAMREISSTIDRMYYRMFVRAGLCRIQYSFNGDRFTDLRQFCFRTSKQMEIGLFAGSPANSSFDCTFREITIVD
jgi:regulation of enolase protein 1 (concanavalin A-like superfamily)